MPDEIREGQLWRGRRPGVNQQKVIRVTRCGTDHRVYVEVVEHVNQAMVGRAACLWPKTLRGDYRLEKRDVVDGPLPALAQAVTAREARASAALDGDTYVVGGDVLNDAATRLAVAALGAVEHLTGNKGLALQLLAEKIAYVHARAGLADA